jgi:chromosome segregation ATPase
LPLSLSFDVSRLKIKQLRAENATLRSRVDEWNQSQQTPTPPAPSHGSDPSSSDKEKKDLMDALVSKDDEMSQLRQEIAKLRDALLSVEATGDLSAALEMEREMRYEAERKAEKERNDRLAAESEWNALSEQVVDDMENSRRQYEKLSDSKADLEKEV